MPAGLGPNGPTPTAEPDDRGHRTDTDTRPFDEGDADDWDRFVQSCPSATVFHRLAWSDSVYRSYGHRPLHQIARAGGRIVGVLPLFLVKSVFVGRVLVSVPYATYGGIAADSEDAAEALLKTAQDLCEQMRGEYLELRHRDGNNLALPEIDRYDTFRKVLPAKAEDVLPSLPRKTRAAARKGLNSLSVSFGPEYLDAIYDLYAVTLKRLGSPNYRRRLFHELRDAYGDDCVCLAVKDGNDVVAGVISYVFRDEIVPYFSGSLPEAMQKNANNVMYLRLMEYAIDRGLKRFDFNRTRRDNHGPHAFKRYHGFEPAPLRYQISLNKAKTLPNLSPSNSKFAMAGRLWRKMPIWLTRPAGARITKWIP